MISLYKLIRAPKVTSFFCIVLSVCLSSAVWAESGTTNCKTLSATGNSEYPPFLWRENEKNNILLGANRIIMDEIGRRLGIPIELRHTGPWSRAQAEVKDGRVDLMAGAFYTMPRAQYMDYVYPAFLNTTSVVWKKKGAKFSFQTRNDLIPLKGVTVINNSFGQEFDMFAKANLNIYFVQRVEQLLKMVAMDRVDYALYEKNPGLAYIDLFNLSDSLQALEPPISIEGLYLTISHKSKCNTGTLRGQLTKIVQEMTADGFMQNALEQGLINWSKFQSK